MSPKKCVRIAIGILASSGVAAILSGGALAASNGQDTTPQNVWIQHGNGNGSYMPQAFQASPTGSDTQQSQNSTDAQPVANSGDVSSSDGNGSSGSGLPSVEQSSGGTSTNGAQVSNSSNAKPSQQAAGPVNGNNGTNGSNAGRAGGGQSQPSSTTPASAVNKNVAGVISEAGTGNTSSLAASEVGVVTPVVEAATTLSTSDSSKGQEVRTAILTIQPVITNRAAALAPDLAESMPTAPAPSRDPVPTKSTGLLAGLVVGLSNVVVPQPVTPADSVTLKLMLGISLLTLVVLLANVFEFSYGQWLRRGGFATAARSDEPSSLTSPLFATPLLSGYVEQPPRLHNPVLLEVVLVPNAYRKEDRR